MVSKYVSVFTFVLCLYGLLLIVPVEAQNNSGCLILGDTPPVVREYEECEDDINALTGLRYVLVSVPTGTLASNIFLDLYLNDVLVITYNTQWQFDSTFNDNDYYRLLFRTHNRTTRLHLRVLGDVPTGDTYTLQDITLDSVWEVLVSILNVLYFLAFVSFFWVWLVFFNLGRFLIGKNKKE